MVSRILRNLRRRLIPERLDQRLRRWRFSMQNAGHTPYAADFTAFGKPHKFWVGDRVGEAWFRAGWDWVEVGYIHDNVIRPGDVVLECGAHHGEMTLLFGDWVGPEGKVVAFDPVELNCSIIAENARINGLSNVRVEHAAVGAAPGSTVITDESNARVAGANGVGRTVAVTTVDTYAHLNPTVLKIDVEGFEGEVLRGAEAVLRTRPRIAMELHPNVLPRFGSSAKEVLDTLSGYGYTIQYRLKGDPEVRPYDGVPIKDEAHLFAFPT